MGVELAAELGVKHGKDKEVALCLRGDRILSSFPERVSRIANDFLKERGVNILYQTPMSPQLEQSYDLVFQCLG